MHSMKYLFEPESIAIVGASSTEGKIGNSVVRNIAGGGFRGAIYPVNPSAKEILGHTAYPAVSSIGQEVDAAVICIPAEHVFEAVKDCVDSGVKQVQIITSGFSEIGEHDKENEIIDYAAQKGTRILGPNIFGIYSAAANLNATFAATEVTRGNVAILTQSGALGIAMMGKTAASNIGLSAMVSLGNKADIDEADCLDYIREDPSTAVIFMYIEGIKKGERFIESLEKTTRVKPVIILKSGRSSRGAMAAASHTGSLAGSDAVFDAIIRQCGALRAESLEDAFYWCSYLSSSPMPGGDNTVIITNGGGIGVMATDACEKYGIKMYDDQTALREIFGPATPVFGSTRNPIDITGGAASHDYNLALSAPAAAPDIHSTIALYCETATFDTENLAPMIRKTWEEHKKAGKPAVYAIVGGSSVTSVIDTLQKENVPVYSDVDEAVSALAVGYRYRSYLETRNNAQDWASIDMATINEIIDRAQSEGRSFLLANEGAAVMQAAGIPVPQSRIAQNLDQAVEYAECLGYPLVMKVVSRDILHKSDAGGVALNLDDKEEIIDAFEAIRQNCLNYNPSAVIDGFEITEQVAEGTEIIVGARRDPAFGPVVMCGLGGIYVEIIKDVVFRALPLNRQEVVGMLEEIKTYPLLLGVRGEERKDIEGLVDTIIKVGTIIKKCNRITDIEINPVVVYEQERGLKAIDTRILISNPKEDSK